MSAIPPDATEAPDQDLVAGDALTQARAAGHSWDDITGHVAQASADAAAAGYTQDEIDQHLGYAAKKPMQDRLRAQWTGHLTANPDIFAQATADQPKLDLTTMPDWRGDYSKALLAGEVKGPRDFSDEYASAALDAVHANLGTDEPNNASTQARTGAAAAASDNLLPQLPSRRDLTDASLSLGDTAAVQANLMGHWEDTGQHPVQAAMAAQNDPSLWSKLTSAVSAKYEDMERRDLEQARQAEANMKAVAQQPGGEALLALAGMTFGLPRLLHAGQELQLHGAAGSDLAADQAQQLKMLEPQMSVADPSKPPGEALSVKPLADLLHPGLQAIHHVAAQVATMAEDAVPGFLHRLLNDESGHVALLRQRLMQGQAAEILPGGIRVENPIPAQHASPYDFDQFDINKVGSGEGQTAYGHGLYFSTARGVHENYWLQFIRQAQEQGHQEPFSYNVALHADPNMLLDWDRPINEQPAGTRSAISQLVEEARGKNLAEGDNTPLYERDIQTGEDLYRHLEGQHGAQEASNILSNAGLHGIRYLDADSRDVGEGSHNYVMFHHDRVEMLDKNGVPVKPTEVVQKVDDIAKGYRAGFSLTDFLTGLWHDQGGTVPMRLGRDKEGYLTVHFGRDKGGLPSEPNQIDRNTPDFGRPKQLSFPMVKGEKPTEYLRRRILTGLQRNRQDTDETAYRLGPFWRTINPHMAEWDTELDKGPAGNPMGTTIGHLIDHIEQRPGGGRIDPESSFFPVAETLRQDEQITERMIRQAHQDGILNPHALVQNHWGHFWKNVSKVGRAFAGWTRQGSGGALRERSIPYFSEGLDRGLEPAITHPLMQSMYLNARTRQYIRQLYMLRDLKDAGVIYASTHGLREPMDQEILGVGTQRAIDKDVMLHTYAPPDVAKLWNRAFGRGMFAQPTDGAKLVETMRDLSMASKAIKLIVPAYHLRATGTEAITGSFARFLSSAVRLEPEALARLAETPLSPITYALKGREITQRYLNGQFDPITQQMADAGELIGHATQDYMPDATPAIWRSIMRGSLGREIAQDWHNVFDGIDKKWHIAPNLIHFVGKQFGRVLTSFTAPLFQHLIPWWKIATEYGMKADYMRRNPNASDLAMLRKDKEIVANTQDRLGELNQDRWFISRFAKNFFNTIMVSPGWEAGFFHWIWRAGRLDETAITTLISFAAVTAAMNTLREKMGLGFFPWQTVTPLLDFAYRRTLGGPAEAEPHRAIDPGYVKDFANLVEHALLMASPFDAGMQGFTLARQKLAPLASLIPDMALGQDAIGHNITQMPGGWPGHIASTLGMPIASMPSATPGSGISRLEQALGTREAPNWVEHFKDWEHRVLHWHQQQTATELRRARKEALMYGEPLPAAAGNTHGNGGNASRTGYYGNRASQEGN